MEILTAGEMKAADCLTSGRFSIPSLMLMENAGHAVARFVLHELPQCRRVTVLCGKGNNAGDGMVAARYLAAAGHETAVVVLGASSEVRGDAKAVLDQLPVTPAFIEQESALDGLRSLFQRSDLFLDAVVGTGFRPPLRGLSVAVRELLRSFPKTPVVAVDLPSGWDADSREFTFQGAYRADAVVTFTAPKLAHAFGMLTQGSEVALPGNLKQGPIVVAPIGSPDEAVTSSTGLFWSGSSKKIADRPRCANSNKGKYGHVLVIGGSKGKAGAPAMASMAALRTGAGLVTAAVPESILPTVARVTPELMTMALSESRHGEIEAKNTDLLDTMLQKKSVVAVGPGMGQAPHTLEFLFALLDKCDVPMVIDADALNALASHLDRLRGRGGLRVLTPHPGEMARLTGRSIAEVEANREALARDFAREHGVILVLKGWRTLIAHPDGQIAVNTTGNPGMAKGGSGDILTGIVAAMLSQYAGEAATAVNAAVYLHGLAADFAVGSQDQHTLLATDTVAHLHQAFAFRNEDAAGYVWLQGRPGSLREAK